MTKRNHYWLLFLPLFFMMACSSTEQKDKTRELEAPQKIEATRSFNVPIRDFSGLEHLLHFENDSTYVINFWATWCKPCVAELPYFERLWEDYRKEKFKVILISLDFPQQIERKLIPFLQKHQLESEIWVLDDADANSWIDKVSPKWSGAIPATLVYNKHTRVFREQSFETYEELNEIVKPLVNTTK